MEYFKCSDCDELHSIRNIELTFRRPDEIASMSDEDVISRCRNNDDIYILDDERYFVRAVIPLPIIDTGENYCIGAWAELSERDFQITYDRWDDEDQADELPMNAKLSNSIPLNSDTFESEVLFKLTSAQSRPNIILSGNDPLANEQENGISLHRAAEYSALVAE